MGPKGQKIPYLVYHWVFGHFPTIPDYFKISEDYGDWRRCPKTTEDFQEQIQKCSTSFLKLPSHPYGKESVYAVYRFDFFFRERNPVFTLVNVITENY